MILLPATYQIRQLLVSALLACGKLPVMAVTNTTTFDIEDIAALTIACGACKAAATLPIAAIDALLHDRKCVSCGESLWRGGDDTVFARALIDARIGRFNRFALVVNEPSPSP